MISLEEAKTRRVCRVCEGPEEEPFFYARGHEFAHRACLFEVPEDAPYDWVVVIAGRDGINKNGVMITRQAMIDAIERGGFNKSVEIVHMERQSG